MKSFLQCAREYAAVWKSREASFVDALSSTAEAIRLAALRRAAGYFRVARNFPKSHDVDRGLPRFKPALDILDEIDIGALTAHNLLITIARLRQDLARAYGRADLLSAATKFLWLRRTDVVIIFDDQARRALMAPYGDYSVYVDLWSSHYERCRADIDAACLQLFHELEPSTRTILGADGGEPPEWFRRRIHDIYLWQAGARGRAESLKSDA